MVERGRDHVDQGVDGDEHDHGDQRQRLDDGEVLLGGALDEQRADSVDAERLLDDGAAA